jgi:group I intron endonuclease
MAIIYKICNKISGKCYIGETIKDTYSRWRGHINSINRNCGCPALKDAIKKYGIDAFVMSVVIICFDKDRFVYEKEYIEKYNSIVPNGYNILEGGEGGGFKGKKHTQETKDKIKKRLKEKYNNPELRLECSQRTINSMKNIDISDRMKNSEKWNNYLIKLKNKKNENSKNKNINKRIKFKIATYDKNNNLLNEYKSMAEAARDTNISLSGIKYNLKVNCVGKHGLMFKKIFA